MEADRSLRLIAITPEIPVEDEAAKISHLISTGFYRVHLRHPAATRTEIRDIIEKIPQEQHGDIVLHGHFDLINDFNLGGLHLNRRCPVPPANYNGHLSRSCHSIDDIMTSAGMQYVTLSPVFDSISKDGYKGAFTPEDLRRLDSVSIPVFALGGISHENIENLYGFNFSGAALLGAIPWSYPLNEFKTITKTTYLPC